MRTSAAAPPANGKVSIAQLVDDGFLLPGNVIVCNNWPFTAVVTPTGTFEARWQPFPNDLVADVGTEYMQAEFVTPSAWATAVCRVMRAQTRAQKAGHAPAQDPPLSPSFVGTGGGRGGSRGKPASASAAGEIRVAVNGWTACRVLVQKGDPNRQLAHQLCSEADQAAGADDAAIEVTLDALRREFVAHNSRRGRAAGRRAAETPKATPQQRREARKSLAALSAGSEDGSGQQMMAVDDAHEGGTGTGTGDTGAGGGGGSGGAGSDSEPEQPLAVDARRTSAEIREITGAVDGLAKRVESDLALGCVKQRRAAAAAADAISAAASALTLSSFFQVAQQTGDAAGSQAQGGARKLVHSRKRKSIPDLSRHTKLSRVPTEDSDGSVSPNRSSMLRLDPQTRDQLTRFRGSAAALKRAQPELKALRYQRKQQLKRRIADALDLWPPAFVAPGRPCRRGF
ncbi:hypothetical protein LPJ61_004146 [Coemansia biformis]|uniref:Uncharacterized protein n=1 Tax=Coemansia biformis TaxID=1286918 RepID=A0A9W7YCG9_9FUNG|nr:hypothetical protein LPJ61_004146 [Coemansia biformis]